MIINKLIVQLAMYGHFPDLDKITETVGANNPAKEAVQLGDKNGTIVNSVITET